ncbi:radical SAM protein [Actinomadura harenae]|uniref:Radical SAM protein n=1 Tax=Actinomadura harenae TaxID=2483351 RepID=A0A3M2LJ72_9ACTN|nr:radical SAM protein [Actinomadura harenae]
MYARLDPGDHARAVSVILKLRGETCDVDCLYCFEKRKETPGGRRVDAAQVHRLAALFAGRPLAVELHGGEPLTAGKAAVADVLRALAASPNVVRVSLQTNGLRLDDAWLDLFDEHLPSLEIGISLDGDTQGNSWRVGYDGGPVYPRVVESLRLLERRNRTTSVICAVTPQILGRAAEIVDHLASFPAVTAISFVPCFDSSVVAPTRSASTRIGTSRVLQASAIGPSGPAWAITPPQYADFVLSAAVHWVRAGWFRKIKLDPVVSVIRRLRGLRTGSCHFDDLKCDHIFTLYPDGRLGSCDELPWPQAQLARLPLLHSQQDVRRAQDRSRLLADAHALIAPCTSCDYQDTCGGGCMAVRRRYSHADLGDVYCDHRMRLVDGVAALLTQPEHPEAVWCTRLRWRPHHPNQMHDVAAFLRRWDDPFAFRQRARLCTSDVGNINTVGLPGVHEADDLDPRHPQWRDGIEPGIFPLVQAITKRWGYITYDSCQGHPATPDAPQRSPSVGILPRDRTEAAVIAAGLCQLATRADDALPPTFRVELGRNLLICATTGNRYPVLDLRLVPVADSSPNDYSAALPTSARLLAELINHAEERPSGDARCRCACPPPASEPRSFDSTEVRQ